MPLKYFRPLTPARRHTSVDAYLDLTTDKPYKPLLKKRKQNAGRSFGRLVVRHKGGGNKRFIRMVDMQMDKFDMEAKISTIEYDPGRNARIALVTYKDGEKRYIVAVEGLKVGETIVSSKQKVEIKNGNRTTLENIPVGVPMSLVELEPGKGAVLARGAGNVLQLMGVEGEFAQLKLPSGQIRLVKKECMATIGPVSNADHRNIRYGKAGRTRHRGIRPTVRGSAMNPVDHPHGGGQGKTPIGLTHPKTPWGKHARGVRTRDPKKTTSKYILSRRTKN